MRRCPITQAACLLLLLGALGGCRGTESLFRPVPESRRQYNSARLLYEGGRYEEAGVAYRAWLADFHDSEDVLRPFVVYQLAECYRLTRDFERAVLAYKKILQLYGETSDPDVKKLIGLARLRLDDVVPKAERRYGAGGPTPADAPR